MKDKTLEVLQKLQERKKLRLKQLEEAEQQEGTSNNSWFWRFCLS